MTMLRLLTLMLLTLVTGTSNGAAQATQNLVQSRIIAERGQVKAGETITIALEHAIAPHWHVYWQNPGDSGTPTRINWNLPEGFEISNIKWPAPKKIPYGPLMNYGYEDNVILLQTLKIPDTLLQGSITITADVEVLVCKEECIPEYGTYALTLNGAESRNEDNSAYIKRAQSKLPLPLAAQADYNEDSGNFILSINLGENITNAIKTETLTFFPEDWGLIQNSAPLDASIKDGILTLSQARGERELDALETIKGVISYDTASGTAQSIAITAHPAGSPPQQTTEANTNSITIPQALLFALIGGLILNLMPCVFPVLSIKALSLVKIADKHPSLAQKHGIAYTLGVVLSFIAIAALLLILKETGAAIGWGFQLQNPFVVGTLAALLFLIGLNLLGAFELKSSFGNIGTKLTQGDGLQSSFFTGVLATLVASPCTAPFMAGAIGFALTQSPAINLAIFASLGFGLALPYLLLSFIPALQKTLPKPGAWMVTFRKILSIPIFLSVIWLLWVLNQQTGVLNTLKPETAASETQLTSVPFSHAKLDILLEGDNAIFVEMTAAWCITCKVNHAIGINVSKTKKAFQDYNVTFMVGDWTNQDSEITKYLEKFGRSGVPIYVYYGAKKNGARPEPIILPQILKPDTISNLIKQSNE